ncbi:MAG: heterodisulfide reductase-related iron-sulfur binding cluster, partial [Nitrospinota bacterium]
EPVNPRTMLAYARTRLNGKKSSESKTRAEAGDFFKRLSQTLKLVAGTQMEPERFRHLTSVSEGRNSKADIVFYFGCNLLQTPHIIFTVLDVFDRLGVDYVVQGGVANCCGVNHLRRGDEEAGGKMKARSLSHFAAFEPEKVVTFCPTCQMQYTERPPLGEPTDFPFEHITRFLADRIDALRALYVRPVEKRVGLHEHLGIPGVNENVRKVLRSVPGLELVEIPQLAQNGYQCPTLTLEPAKRALKEKLFSEARAAGIDTLATVYHSCYRELCGEEANHPFGVCNFISLVGEAMGIHHDALFQRFRLYGDIQRVLDESEPYMRSNGMDPEMVRDSLANILYGAPPPAPLSS